MSRWLLRWHIGWLALLLPDASQLVPLARLLAWLTPRGPLRCYRGLSEQEIVRLVRNRLHRPWRMRGRRCLREALLCFHFLRLAGVPAEVHFGVFVRARGREFAHCWVVVSGRCVTSPPQDDYVLVHAHCGGSR
jgi:hypothetical protein